MSGEWRDHFEVVDGNDRARKKCLKCGEVMDCRAGRGQKHLRTVHGMLSEGPVAEDGGAGSGGRPPEPTTPALKQQGENPPPSKYPRGSREWAIEKVLEVADADAATPEQKLKALDLLKEYEQYEGAAKFDDQIERQKHIEQFERAIERAKELRAIEKKLLKDHATRQDLYRALKEAEG